LGLCSINYAAPAWTRVAFTRMRSLWEHNAVPWARSTSVFLMADAVLAAKAKQKTPDGYYNVERMLKGVLARKGVTMNSIFMPRTR
jgi:sulfur relay (sulfurtransferase) complex TusBCD TusD component (DsrE family)